MSEKFPDINRKIKVMVIEDSVVEAFIVEQMIGELDFIESFTIYYKAREAFNFILDADENDLPDLVLLDLHLDQGDGYEFIDEMEFSAKFSEGFPFKIYILTNATWEENKAIYQNQKYATGFFQKPIDANEFARKIAEDFPA